MFLSKVRVKSQLAPAGYVRRSSHMQAENFSLDAQKRAITEECQRRNLPDPIFYIDDELSARSEQIEKRKEFQRLLKDVAAGRVQVVFVHSLDRWSRNVMVTLQSFRILSENQAAFISLSEHIDYSTPEGRLQLTILAAFAAYFSDMLAKHVSKGKGQRAYEGLFNGDIPYGYRHTSKKTPSEPDPETFPGLRMIGELRMNGFTASQIADRVNTAGYRIKSKRFGERLFSAPTINAITSNPFYAAFAPNDDRGTIIYQEKRYRGQHIAAFTYQEWERIRQGAQINYNAPHRAARAHVYAFSGYVCCVHCGTSLRAKGFGESKYSYYKDMSKERHISCPVGGRRQVRKSRVAEQFGELLQGFQLPEMWRQLIQEQLIEAAQNISANDDSSIKEKDRLTLKRSRILKQYREGYIDDNEYESEIASVELALRQLNKESEKKIQGIAREDVIALGEKLPEIASVWNMATVQEQREWINLLIDPGGVAYDLEAQQIASLTPRPTFLPLLRLMGDLREFPETTGTLVSSLWRPKTPHRRDQFRSHL